MCNVIVILQPAAAEANVVFIILFTIILTLLILMIILTIGNLTCNSLILEASSLDAAFPPKSSNNQKWSPIAPD